MNLVRQQRTLLIKEALQKAGFDVAFSKARKLQEEEERLSQWLKAHHHGEMSYMENHFDMRLDPRLLHLDTQTIISISYNYFPEPTDLSTGQNKISKYAWGKDYHKVVKKRLKAVMESLRKEIGDFSYRMCVDSAPVLEKKWAELSGLGWIGKHSNLITKQKGSFFFLGEILTDLDLEEGRPIKDYCGSCTKCIDACPTQAITPYNVDGSKCISYLTIELKDGIPEQFTQQMDEWAFGCDVCQDVCPWNRFASPHNEEKFIPKKELIETSESDFEGLSEADFNKLFEGSAIRRTGYKGFMRNLSYLKRNRL